MGDSCGVDLDRVRGDGGTEHLHRRPLLEEVGAEPWTHRGCDSPFDVLPTGEAGGFQPVRQVGAVIPRGFWIERHSGKHYATPVVAEQTPDGFVVPLPYGAKVDWLRNLLAAGRAEVQVSGYTHAVVEPKIIDAASAALLLPTRRRRTYQLFGSRTSSS